MGLFDRFRRHPGGSRPPDVHGAEDYEIIERTNWEVDGAEVVRGFRFRNRKTGREDKLILSIKVEMGELGRLHHFFHLTLDPPITGREQEVHLLLMSEGDVPPGAMPAVIGLTGDGQNYIGMVPRDGVGRAMAVLYATEPFELRLRLVDGTRYARRAPNDGSYRRLLKERQDVLLAQPFDLRAGIERLTGRKLDWDE